MWFGIAGGVAIMIMCTFFLARVSRAWANNSGLPLHVVTFIFLLLKLCLRGLTIWKDRKG